jgi:hypothetical protein
VSDDEIKLPIGIYSENTWWNDYHSEKKEADEKEKKFCLHKWIKYKGFNEDYWFCEKCDEKKLLQEDEV